MFFLRREILEPIDIKPQIFTLAICYSFFSVSTCTNNCYNNIVSHCICWFLPLLWFITESCLCNLKMSPSPIECDIATMRYDIATTQYNIAATRYDDRQCDTHHDILLISHCRASPLLGDGRYFTWHTQDSVEMSYIAVENQATTVDICRTSNLIFALFSCVGSIIVLSVMRRHRKSTLDN